MQQDKSNTSPSAPALLLPSQSPTADGQGWPPVLQTQLDPYHGKLCSLSSDHSRAPKLLWSEARHPL